MTHIQNKVELLGHFGNDLMVVNVARVSYDKWKDEFDSWADSKLIKYLKEHKHTSPWRHPQLQFRIHCPIFVERQLFKHQVGMSANSRSGRYVDFSDEYWIPDELRQQSKSSKQGSSEELVENQDSLIGSIIAHSEKSAELYADLVRAGVSKEQARIVCPLNLMTTFIWTGSMLSFLHLWDLRLKPDAQKETREIAIEMLNLVKNIPGEPFKYTIEAFEL